MECFEKMNKLIRLKRGNSYSAYKVILILYHVDGG